MASEKVEETVDTGKQSGKKQASPIVAFELPLGESPYISNCLPVRSLHGFTNEGPGHWFVGYRLNQLEKFLPEGDDTAKQRRVKKKTTDNTPEVGVFDGFLILQHSKVCDPSDLCSLNVTGLGLQRAKESDFILFDNLLNIIAGDNELQMEYFHTFRALLNLDLPLNNIDRISIRQDDFHQLESLDLSYNQLTSNAILPLRFLRSLKKLNLAGNQIDFIPEEFRAYSRPTQTTTTYEEDYSTVSDVPAEILPSLEELILNENYLSDHTVFMNLSLLKSLKILSLQDNGIAEIPFLQVVGKDEERVPSKVASVLDVRSNITSRSGDGASAPASGRQAASTIQSRFDSILSQSMADEHILYLGPVPFPIPFTKLASLDVSDNFFSEEDTLLPVAAMPALRTLIICGNPIVLQTSGTPPLLRQYLGDILGLDLVRFHERPPKKPRVQLRRETMRTVSTHVPKIPRVDMSKMFPPTDTSIMDQTYRNIRELMGHMKPMDPNEPLPILHSDIRLQHKGYSHQEDVLRIDSQLSLPPIDAEKKNPNSFFMTEAAAEEQEAAPTQSHHQRPKVPLAFEGYEDLYFIDGEEEIDAPKELGACVRQLKWRLEHPVDTEEIRVDLTKPRTLRLMKSDKPTHRQTPPKKRREREQSLILRSLKERKTVEIFPLKDAQERNEKNQKQFPEASQLMSSLQTKYDVLRRRRIAEYTPKRCLRTQSTTSITDRP